MQLSGFDFFNFLAFDLGFGRVAHRRLHSLLVGLPVGFQYRPQASGFRFGFQLSPSLF
jgi:hypothetical protein